MSATKDIDKYVDKCFDKIIDGCRDAAAHGQYDYQIFADDRWTPIQKLDTWYQEAVKIKVKERLIENGFRVTDILGESLGGLHGRDYVSWSLKKAKGE